MALNDAKAASKEKREKLSEALRWREWTKGRLQCSSIVEVNASEWTDMTCANVERQS